MEIYICGIMTSLLSLILKKQKITKNLINKIKLKSQAILAGLLHFIHLLKNLNNCSIT